MGKDINNLFKKILKNLKKFEFNSFLIGIKKGQGINKELKMELGQRLEKELKKPVDFKRPDITIILDLEKEDISLKLNQLYLYGRYKKLKRGISQTKWLHKDYNKNKNIESVEELIKNSILQKFKGENLLFHGCGREDMDVLMLGNGRPFVIEITKPIKRFLDLKKIEKKINKENKGKIEISDLKLTKKELIREIKESKPDKTYVAIVETKKEFNREEIKNALKELEKSVINQQTPIRVIRRRSDLTRKRKIRYIRLISFQKDSFKIELKTESGLYIKELISGDKGRTIPSLSSLLGEKEKTLTKVRELDVIQINTIQKHPPRPLRKSRAGSEGVPR